jgi:glutamine synthetase
MLEAAKYYHEVILADMEAVRAVADQAETYLPEYVLPYPTYDQLLFSV